jgi:hypothetical protein
MPGLNVHADPEKYDATSKSKWNRGPKVILAVVFLLLIPVVGTSLASSVTINNVDNKVTFGQGYLAALACDENVTITPHVVFNYTAPSGATPPSGAWNVDYLTLSDIDTNDAGCGGKTITLQVMKGQNNALEYEIIFDLPTEELASTTDAGLHSRTEYTILNTDPTYEKSSKGISGDSLKINFTASFNATLLDGFTIQQS